MNFLQICLVSVILNWFKIWYMKKGASSLEMPIIGVFVKTFELRSRVNLGNEIYEECVSLSGHNTRL